MYFKIALQNVKKSMRDYAIYFITLVFGVCVFYAFNSFTQQAVVLDLSEVQDQMIEFLTFVIGGVSVFVAVVLGFLIIYANRYLIRRRNKEFGTYLLLGMPAGKVSRIIIYETLFVGVISLAIGLVAGVALSQALLYITAALFAVKMKMFVFLFSWTSLIQTVVYFGVVFLTALIFNVTSVSRFRLINLINAQKKNEGFKLKNRPLMVVLFVVSLVLIGISYALLLNTGLGELNQTFLTATVLVCIGTILFFFSLAGFLLSALQSNKGLYLRGLNMFTTRQLGSKIHTAFASISLVCLVLFLSVTAVCGGISLCSTLGKNIQATTIFDASLRAMFEDMNSSSEELSPWTAQAAADDFDMALALERDIEDWDELVKATAQVDFFFSDVPHRFVFERSDAPLSTGFYSGDSAETMLSVIPLSSFNAQRELLGLDAVTLESDEFLLWSDFSELFDVYSSFLERGEEVVLFGTTLHPSDHELETMLTETSAIAMNTGALVVVDELITDDAPRFYSALNVMYNGSRDDIEPRFEAALSAAYFDSSESGAGEPGWPLMAYTTAVFMQEQNTGLSLVISYVAIYIGFVLLVACAAILALQQLSESADNIARYALLQKLGADERMINGALLQQIGVYFAFPLALALCHAGVALKVVLDTVAIFGITDVVGPLAASIGIFLLVYGGYFLITYFASRSMVSSSRRLVV